MAYWFAGFLVPTKHDVVSIPALPEDALCRPISSPFIGVGVRFPSLIGKTPSALEINALATETGVSQAASWLYISYETFGRLDSVYAMGVQDGRPFGPVDDSDLQSVEGTFIEAMARIGVSREDALRFEPFNRGFWAPQA